MTAIAILVCLLIDTIDGTNSKCFGNVMNNLDKLFKYSILVEKV